jgi:glyoxylase-like metal-dependent hydrolase (beta-lactamase superfamily II)
MKRVIVLGMLMVVGALSLVVSAQQQGGQQARVVEVEKLKDNLWVLKGGGGNTAVFVTANGVVVVDAKNPGWGQPILDQIKMLTDKPITTLINTHTHGDHVSGNVEFPATVDIVTHENTKANMERMVAPTGFPPATGNIFTQNNGRGMPKRTFRDRMTIGNGNDRVELFYFGRAHTNGDAWVVIPALRVMHAGDSFAGKNVPLLDANNGGSGVEYPDTLMKVHNGIQNVDTIITGHSTQMTWAELREFAEFNRDFREAVRAGKQAGRTVDQIASAWTVPAKYAGYGTPQPPRLRANVEVVYNELR